MTHWVIIYTPFIHNGIRFKELEKANSFPCRILGHEYTWLTLEGDHASLAIVERPNKKSLAIAFKVKEDLFSKLDALFPSYIRRTVVRSLVDPIGAHLPKGTYWTYYPNTNDASSTFVALSYIDAIVDSLFNYGFCFSREFLLQSCTTGIPWKNDRENPCIRNYPKNINTRRIDTMLQRTLPHVSYLS